MARSSAIFLVLAVLALIVFIRSTENPSGPLIRTRIMMGTVVEIQVHDQDSERFDGAVTAAFAAMTAIENLMSPHQSASEVSRLSAENKSMAVSEETIAVLQIALNVANASHGAFDVALGRLIELWGFAEGHPRIPSEAEIQAARLGLGPDSLSIVGDTIIKKQPDLAIDLGGVAKGSAIDQAVAVLAAAGVQSASVNAGGDIRLLGDRSGSPWRIGIQNPRQTGEVLARLNLVNRAVVTSGDYERFFEQEGIRYHHILDPATGHPARLSQSVTIVADNAALADALATAVFVLGPEKGMDLLRETDHAEGLIVAADGTVKVTSGLQEVISWP